MRDITILKSELVQCECELASLTRKGDIDHDVYSYVNYIDPSRALFLKDKINFILSQIETKEN